MDEKVDHQHAEAQIREIEQGDDPEMEKHHAPPHPWPQFG